MLQTSSRERVPKPRLYSLGQYLAREEKAQDKHEFYNGIIRKMPGGTFRHNEIASNTLTALKAAVRGLPGRYRVLNSDQKIYVEPANTGVYPDALVICEEPIFYQGRPDLITNPLVVVEVLSRSTAAYDRQGKFLLYQQLPSFREYVLIEQTRPEVETWFREEENLWRKTVVGGLDAQVLMRALGVSLRLGEVYENVLFPENH
jgi:Uma2 family endonuclease